jgi:ribosomal protein L13E
VVCKHSGRGVSGAPSNDVRLEAPMRAIREASTRRKTFRVSRKADTGRGFSGSTRQNLSN